MKKIKKTYRAPILHSVVIDQFISLQLNSLPPTGPDEYAENQINITPFLKSNS